MNNNSSKQILLSVIGVAILVIAVVGVSFAFFSYIYNGENANTIETGTIVFQASDSVINLTNQFPQDAINASKATVSVSGNTTYENGIDFQVRVTDVTNAGTIVPRVKVTAKAGTNATVNVTTADYSKTNPLTDGVIATGNIPANTEIAAVTEVLEIQAYYSKDDYHISNTSTKEQLIAAKLLPAGWAGEVISTDTWNALSSGDNAYSFKIQVIAVEGGQTIPRY